MQRVMIVGGPGSGKSLLAREIGARTGLPVFHIDRIHWLPGWVERSRDEKTRLCREVHARDRWIFEGGHSVTWPERLARADALVWLDLPVALRQWRVLRRTLLHLGETRPDLPDGCPERLDAGALEFWRYIWRSRRPARARMAALFAEAPPGTMRVRLRSGREVRRFLDRLGQPAGPANPPASVASKTAR